MLRHPFLRTILAVSLLVVVALPLHAVLLAFPDFSRLTVQQTEREAQRVANHLSVLVLPPGSTTLDTSPAVLSELHVVKRDFGLLKFRVFDAEGTILASSTPREVGEVNTKPYFREVVAQGSLYTKTVRQDQPTAEGRISVQDVVETYVPILRDGRFMGAFEIYYDISSQNNALHQMLNHHGSLQLGGAALLLLLLVMTLQRASRTLARQEAADRAVRENEARLRAILDSAQDGIVTMDGEGRFSSLNPAAEAIFGYGKGELVDQRVADTLVPPELREAHLAALARAVQGQESREGHPTPPRRMELEGLHADGHRIPLEISVTPAHGIEPIQFTAILRDVTERKQMLLSLEDALASAQEANQAKSAFLASTSHEIRTPLNAIIGYGELLLEAPRDALLLHYNSELQRILGAANHLLELLNDILDLSKIEAGQMELELQPLQPARVLEDVAAIFEDIAHRKGLNLTFDTDPELPDTILGDRTRLRQILFNLLGNAVKFTHRGEIHLRAEPGKRPGEEGMMLLSVSDTGIGIPPARQHAIFEAFTQADSTITRRFGGTGLGLNICARLAALMEGSIWVKSTPGEGSTFYCLVRARPPGNDSAPLPLQRATPEERTHPPSHRRQWSPPHPMRILLVDDTEDNRLLVQAFLKGVAFEVASACNGAEAVQQFRQHPFDLVLMDVQMPVMDGYEATRRIRQWEREQNRAPTPILAFTAHTGAEETRRILEAGCTLHLGKPVKKARLLEAIATLN